MCVKLNLKEDVAGASFMAFGASAPEIVISIITTIQGGDNVDIGVGYGDMQIPDNIIESWLNNIRILLK